MQELILEAQLREEKGKGKAGALRREGLIPAVIYGENKKTELLKIERRAFLRLLHGHRAESAVINLKILSDGDSKKAKEAPVIIKEMQYEPISEEILHIDFNRISLTKAITVKVPIEAKGEAIGVKQEAGSLEHVLWDLEIECLPTQIPEKIEVDVSALRIGDAIHVKDISLPAEIKVLADPNAVVLSLAAPIKEEVVEEDVGEEAAAAEPEVIKEKKEKPEEAVPSEEKQEKTKAKEEKAPKEEKK